MNKEKLPKKNTKDISTRYTPEQLKKLRSFGEATVKALKKGIA